MLQYSKIETFRPETGKSFLDHERKVALLTLGENSGPVPGRKVSFHEHCIFKNKGQDSYMGCPRLIYKNHDFIYFITWGYCIAIECIGHLFAKCYLFW